MTVSQRVRSKDAILALALAAYASAGLSLASRFRYLLNPDAISYISIARDYAHGRWSYAVNGYWGPLWSWLLVPFVKAGVDGLLAGRLLNVAVGALVIVGTRHLAAFVVQDRMVKELLLVPLVFLVLKWALASPLTPDLLLVALLVQYLRLTFSRSQGLAAGVLGGFAYLAKGFALPFVLAHVLLFNLVLARRPRRALVTLGGLAAVCAPWIVVISRKYRRPTFSTAGAYNWALVGPHSQGQPMGQQGLIRPPNPSAPSAWEDPSYLHVPSWHVTHNVGHLLGLIGRNLRDLDAMLTAFSPFALALVVAALIVLLRRPVDVPTAGIVLTAGLYVAGYSFVQFQDRYVWLVYVLLLLFMGRLTQLLTEVRVLSPLRRAAVLVALLGTVAVGPAWVMWHRQYGGRDVRDLARVLQRVGVANSRLASDDAWTQSVYLSYHLSAHYYGEIAPGAGVDEARRQLLEHRIRYFLVWKSARAPTYLDGWTRVGESVRPMVFIRNGGP